MLLGAIVLKDKYLCAGTKIYGCNKPLCCIFVVVVAVVFNFFALNESVIII